MPKKPRGTNGTRERLFYDADTGPCTDSAIGGLLEEVMPMTTSRIKAERRRGSDRFGEFFEHTQTCKFCRVRMVEWVHEHVMVPHLKRRAKRLGITLEELYRQIGKQAERLPEDLKQEIRAASKRLGVEPLI